MAIGQTSSIWYVLKRNWIHSTRFPGTEAHCGKKKKQNDERDEDSERILWK